MVTTQWIFLSLVALLALQRISELRLSRRNEDSLRALGAQEHGADHFPIMKLLHTTWFLAMLGEVFWLDRPWIPAISLAGLALVVLGQSLRYAAIHTLGPLWTVRILTLPGTGPVEHGIYRFIRHPNYLGVILEIFAVPLLHTAYLTTILFTVLNAILLRVRIRAEERALTELNESVRSIL